MIWLTAYILFQYLASHLLKNKGDDLKTFTIIILTLAFPGAMVFALVSAINGSDDEE